MRVFMSYSCQNITIKNGKEVLDPIIHELPIHCEDQNTRDEVRYNVLGIYALPDFSFVINF